MVLHMRCVGSMFTPIKEEGRADVSVVISGFIENMGLYYIISQIVYIPCSEQQDDRGVGILLIVFSGKLRCVLESVSIHDCLFGSTFRFLLFTFHCGYETLSRHPLDIFLLISGEVDIWYDELIRFTEARSEFGE